MPPEAARRVGVGGRTSRAPWAAGRRPSKRAARKSRRNPLKRLKTGSGLAGGRSRDRIARRVDRLAVFGQLETQARRRSGRGRARVSRGLSGGTPPLRQSRPEKLAQPFEKAQNRLGSGGRPKPRPVARRVDRLAVFGQLETQARRRSGRGRARVAVVCAAGRASARAWAAGRRPSDRAARKSRRKPLKRLKTGSGLAGGRSRDRVDRLAVFAQLETQAGRGVGRGRARVSRGLGGGTPPLRQSRPEKPAQPFEKAQNRLGSGGRPKPRPVARGSIALPSLVSSKRRLGVTERRLTEASGPDDVGESKKAPEAVEKAQNGVGNGKAAQSGTR